jgi:hypothetical protein
MPPLRANPSGAEPHRGKPYQCSLGAGGLHSGDAGVAAGVTTLGGLDLAASGHLGEFASAYFSSAP